MIQMHDIHLRCGHALPSTQEIERTIYLPKTLCAKIERIPNLRFRTPLVYKNSIFINENHQTPTQLQKRKYMIMSSLSVHIPFRNFC
ncbi:hypothetical protein Sjap_023482 [Stephania japonica]|uniref:Uncharacterized protein n=1 Tax=Stephania japonica TaxID=461633 RepID=A0AAP0EDU5_9MAGN